MSICNLRVSIEDDMGEETELELEIEYSFHPGSPASLEDPGSPDETEIQVLNYDFEKLSVRNQLRVEEAVANWIDEDATDYAIEMYEHRQDVRDRGE